MAEYIDREAAIRILSFPISMSICLDVDECNHKRSQREIDLELIKSISVADVQPVVHGRWISIGHKLSRICSVCNCDEPYKFADDDANVYDYCPNCGARMDGET